MPAPDLSLSQSSLSRWKGHATHPDSGPDEALQAGVGRPGELEPDGSIGSAGHAAGQGSRIMTAVMQCIFAGRCVTAHGLSLTDILIAQSIPGHLLFLIHVPVEAVHALREIPFQLRRCETCSYKCSTW